MGQGNNRVKLIRRAAVIALIGNLILAALKIAAGLYDNSGALLGDGIDSGGDVLIGLVTLIVVGIMSKPADKQHPWGHGRAETVATAFLSFVILFAGAQLIFDSVMNFIDGSFAANAVPSLLSVVISCVSIGSKFLLALSQYLLGKRADSAMIKANAKNMAGDTLLSVGVLCGLLISIGTQSALADSVFAVLVGLWILKNGVTIFLSTNLDLMDGSRSTKAYRVIADAVAAVEGAGNPHRARMRKIGGFWDIHFDIEVAPDCTVSAAHEIACKVESEIKARLENVFDIMIHIEPKGDCETEAFGLTEREMCGEAEEKEKTG